MIENPLYGVKTPVKAPQQFLLSTIDSTIVIMQAYMRPIVIDLFSDETTIVTSIFSG